jgi:AcrR family transcriptional regulator
MTAQARRQRERAERERLIITAARDLAEAEGWGAVTTRRLAERVEYSQPVLYTHFSGKDAIMAAVAVEGAAELADDMRAARTAATDAEQALAAVARAYVAFADRRPAIYDAVFNQPVGLPFATPEAPAALHDAFDQLRQVVRPVAAGDDENLLAELFWSGLHGLVSLTRGGRLTRESRERRLAIYLRRFAQAASSST